MERYLKPDFDMIKTILVKAVERNHDGADLKNDDFKPEELEDVAFQVLLLRHGGYVEAEYEPRLSEAAPPDFAIKGLTFEGHSLLKLMQDETMWRQVTKLIAEKEMETDFDTIKVAVALIIDEMLSGVDSQG